MDSKKKALKVITNDKKITKMNGTVDLDDIQITPPAHLLKNAQALWRILIPEIKKMGYLKRVDQSNLELYCTYYALYLDAEDELRDNGAYIRSKAGNPLSKAPQAIQLNDCVRNMKSLGYEMGFSFDAGLRQLTIAKPHEKKTKTPLKEVKFGADV
ncbi:phage terminase small subunit P27 family [Lactiplantibacillus paraxiangfangensis]|uniref:phage terminase small subunit P27 family n=1 Tax=Lactiplantibacillus paraxiangfangensis TaxID=3076224 RepID=UPI0030C6FA73